MSPEQRADARRLADELEIFGAFRPEVRATVGALLRSLAEQPEAAQPEPLTDAEIMAIFDAVDPWRNDWRTQAVRAIERRVRGGPAQTRLDPVELARLQNEAIRENDANKAAGFGAARVKREGDIANPDDYTWEHDPHSGVCPKCTARYGVWKIQYDAQERSRK